MLMSKPAMGSPCSAGETYWLCEAAYLFIDLNDLIIGYRELSISDLFKRQATVIVTLMCLAAWMGLIPSSSAEDREPPHFQPLSGTQTK